MLGHWILRYLNETLIILDPRAEFEIYSQFHDMVKGKSVVYISHRLSSSKFCDVIAVFENGCIIEYGTQVNLVNSGGKYAELFRMQADYLYLNTAMQYAMKKGHTR